MRRMSLLLLGLAAGSCTTAPPSPTQLAQSRAHFEQLTAGKVAEAPISCLPHYNSNDMVVIDENTIAFRAGASRVYIAHMNGPCSNLGGPSYALVTKSVGGMGLCRGDIATVVDTNFRATVGSCTFGDFVPYVRPRS
jgi:hypothetical protein